MGMAKPDYVPPRRFVVDAETAARIEDRLANPRKPNDALRALLAKERTDG